MSERVPLLAAPRPAWLAGLLAGGLALLALLAGSWLTGSNGFLEVVANGATALVPLGLFDAILAALGPYAKGLLFAGVAAAVPLAGALLGAVLARLWRIRGGPGDAILVAAIVLGLAELVVLPLAGAGIAGSAYVGDPLALHGPLVVAAGLYGWAFVELLGPLPASAGGTTGPVGGAETVPDGETIPRRAFLGRSLATAGLLSLAGSGLVVAGRVLAAASVPLGRTAVAGRPLVDAWGVTPRVTSTDRFYTVAKDLVPTKVDPATWRLDVSGLVDRPRSYSLAELAALPRVEGYRTLQCISIEVVRYDSLVSNGWWAGVRARDLLDAVGVQPAATYVLWRSADGYTESIPIDVARDERTWLVTEMGGPGQALPAEHGAPLRVLIAGRYGMKQPKWLTGIQLADHDEQGFWEQRGWDEQAIVRTYSRIDQPVEDETVPSDRPFEVYGIADAGDRGIARVEVSADGGRTWTDAELEPATPQTSDLTWRRWRASVRAPGEGRTILTARATDGQGGVQSDVVAPPLPAGAGGLIKVDVVAIPGS